MAAIGSDEAIEAVGRVVSVVGRTMVVQSGRGDATRERETDLDGVDETLDEESVLCTRDRRGLGAIEEVFGPVSAPLYALRLPEEVTAETGDEVFVVVGRSRRIPNVARLYKKGYDASGKDDEEVVEEEEFSDDEEEAAAKAARKKASGKKRSSGARGGGAKPSPMGGGGMFGMRGLPRPPPPPPSAAMGQMGGGGAPPPPSAAGQPMMYVPVRYDARDGGALATTLRALEARGTKTRVLYAPAHEAGKFDADGGRAAMAVKHRLGRAVEASAFATARAYDEDAAARLTPAAAANERESLYV